MNNKSNQFLLFMSLWFDQVKKGLLLSMVPPDYRDYDTCLLAVKNDPMMLSSVPNELRNSEICKIAARGNPNTINLVSDDLQPEIYLFSRQYNCTMTIYPYTLLRNEELIDLAVADNGLLLQFIPERLKTPELCKKAVSNKGTALRHVPMDRRTSELCLLAVSESSNALKFVPDEIKDRKLCITALRPYNWTSALYIPTCLEEDEYIKWLMYGSNNYPLQLWASHVIRNWVLKWLYRPSGERVKRMFYSACNNT